MVGCAITGSSSRVTVDVETDMTAGFEYKYAVNSGDEAGSNYELSLSKKGVHAMFVEKKEEIKAQLDKLELEINTDNMGPYIRDIKYPSLVLWSKYQRYLNEILLAFEAKSEDEYKRLARIITLLKLDEFSVNASEEFEKSKRALTDYIKLARKDINRKV